MRIETERLVITEFDISMAESVHRGSLDEDNRRFVPDEVFETVEEAAETVGYLIGCRKSGQGPQVCPVLLRDGTYVGYVQAVPIGEGEWEIGYHIAGGYTGRGYATEAVRAFLPAMLDVLGTDRMTGICLADNLASARVMEKCGFVRQFEGQGSYQGSERRICRFLYVRRGTAEQTENAR